MNRTARILTLLVAAVLAGTALTGSAQAQPSGGGVPASVRAAIERAPHPYLHRFCAGDPLVASDRILRAKVGARVVLVALVTCKYGTAGVPSELAVYDARGRLRYRLDSGAPHATRAVWARVIEGIAVSGRGLTVRYAGYTNGDAMCCPSHAYLRTARLSWKRATLSGFRKLH